MQSYTFGFLGKTDFLCVFSKISSKLITFAPLYPTPLCPPNYSIVRGGPRNIFLPGILIFLLFRSPYKFSEPFDKPLWDIFLIIPIVRPKMPYLFCWKKVLSTRILQPNLKSTDNLTMPYGGYFVRSWGISK